MSNFTFPLFCLKILLLLNYSVEIIQRVKMLGNSRFASEKYFFRVQKALITMLGFWPGSDTVRIWQLIFAIFNALEISIHGIFQMNFCIKNIDNVVLLLNGLTPLVTQTITVEKIVIIVWKRKELKRILDYLQDSFVNGKLLI